MKTSINLRQQAFNKWLFKTTKNAITESTLAIKEDSVVKKNKDNEDDTNDDAENKDKVDQDNQKEQNKEKTDNTNRGGQQQAKAAIRDVPAPSEDALTLTMVVDKLNAVRSGKSLKDDDVRKHLGEYFVDLNPAERLALFAFLEGIAEIVAADVPGAHARAPNDPDINIEMSHDDTDLEDSNGSDQHHHVNQSNDSKSSASISGGRNKGIVTNNQDHNDDGPVLVVKR